MKQWNLIQNKNSNLYKVFSHLGNSERIISDDTQLEKLCAWLEAIADDQEAARLVLSHSEVLGLFMQVADSEPQEPFQALMFALRLAPYLVIKAENDAPPIPTWLNRIFNKAIVWSNGSTRSAWVTGLKCACKTKVGLLWAVSMGFMTFALDLMEDTSVFVTKEAHALFSAVLTDFPDLPETKRLVNDVLGRIKHNLTMPVMRCLPASLGLIRSLCTVIGPDIFSESQVRNDLIKVLLDCEKWSNRSISGDIVSTLIRVDGNCQQISEESTKLEDLVQDLLNKRHIRTAISLSSQLLAGSGYGQKELQIEVLMLPVNCISNSETLNVEISILRDIPTSTFTSLLQHSINLASSLPRDERAQLFDNMCNVFHSLVISGSTHKPIDNTEHSVWHQAASRDLRTQFALLSFIADSLQNSTKESTELLPGSIASTLFQDCITVSMKTGISVNVSNKAFECITAILKNFDYGQVDLNNELLGQLAELIVQGMCDIRWEIRDTAISTTNTILKNAKANGKIMLWFSSHQIAHQVWQSMSDQESYVRAAAISSLKYWPQHEASWSQVTTNHSESAIIAHLQTILKEDSEAFARRAAVHVICEWLKMGTLASHKVSLMETLNSAMHDLDWEVKLSVIQYWGDILQTRLETIAPQEVPAHASGLLIGCPEPTNSNATDKLNTLLSDLDTQGCLQCLITGTKDYDRSVQHRACTILVNLRDVCKKIECTVINEGSTHPPKRCKLSEGQTTDPTSSNRQGTVDCFLLKLETLFIDDLLENSSTSIDEYVRDPESLFQDILVSLAKDDDENAVDCY